MQIIGMIGIGVVGLGILLSIAILTAITAAGETMEHW